MGQGTPLRVGIIGCGRIFAKHLAAIDQHADQLKCVAVCDPVVEATASLSEGRGIRAYRDLNQMLESERLDLAVILTPSGEHGKQALLTLKKVPNVVVEKPMALRLQEADEMIELAEKLGRRLFVVKQNRYNPPVVALRSAIDQGRLGRLLLTSVRVRWARDEGYYRQAPWRGTWLQDGGVCSNQASHHLDLMQWLMGPVESVYALTSRFMAPIEAEDTTVVALRFKSGAIGTFEATTCARPKDLEGSISILGEGGSVEIGGFAVNQMKTWSFVRPEPQDAELASTATSPPNVYGFGHSHFYADVIECIRHNRPAMIDGREGRKSLELIHAIYESAESGREVLLDGFVPRLSRLGRS